MNRSHFFDAVQEELDRACDPLDCPELVAYLEGHPEDLEDFAALRAVGLSLSGSAAPTSATATVVEKEAPTPLRRLRPWKPLWAAAAAVLVFAVGLQLTPKGSGDPERDPTTPFLLRPTVASGGSLLRMRTQSSTLHASVVRPLSSDSAPEARVLHFTSRTTQRSL